MAFLDKAIIRAVGKGDTQTVLKILSEPDGYFSNAKDAFYHAALLGNLEIISAILDMTEARPEWLTEIDWTLAVNQAAARGSIEVIQLLLKRLKVSDEDADKWWAGRYFYGAGNSVISAAYGGQSEFIRLLGEYGADVNLTLEDRDPPLFYAAKAGTRDYCPIDGDVASVEALLAFGANIDHQNGEGHTALHVALIYQNFDTARVLIAHGANLNIFNKQEWSPLRMALSSGAVKFARTLLEHGASLEEKDAQGVTTREWAQQNGKSEFVEKLEAL